MFYTKYKILNIVSLNRNNNAMNNYDILKKIKEYSKVNTYSFMILSMNLPYSLLIFYINLWDIKCKDAESVMGKLHFLHMIFFFLYPYFVKIKLNKFS